MQQMSQMKLDHIHKSHTIKQIKPRGSQVGAAVSQVSVYCCRRYNGGLRSSCCSTVCLLGSEWEGKRRMMFAEECQSQTDRVHWDFGGLATERHKQPVSSVAVILPYPLWVTRG